MYDFSFLNNINYEVIDTPLSVSEVAEFEQINNIIIPYDYRSFLTNVGNGIKIKVSPRDIRVIFGIKRPIIKRYNRRITLPFIFDEPYHERLHTHEFEFPDDCIDPEDEEENSCEHCVHLDNCFFAYSDNLSEYDHVIFNGAYPVCYAGCTYTYFLLITGKHRGEVWINNETSDFAPSKKSFYDFLKWATSAEVI